EDVRLVRKDVVLEASLEREDVVVCDRTSAEDHLSPMAKASGKRKGAPRGAPLAWGGGQASRRRAERRRVLTTAGFREASRRGVSSVACSSRLAVRAMVLKDPLKIRSVLLATSPMTSWRRAWTLTRCSPLTASFSGSFWFPAMPKTLTLAGIMALA